VRSWRTLLIVCVGLAVVALVRTYFDQHRPSTDPTADYSSLRTNQWGTKAFRQLCSHFGLQGKTWKQPLFALPAEARLIVLLNPFKPFEPNEIARLEEWVEQGGHLILAVRDAEPNHVQRNVVRLDGNHALLAWLGLAIKRVTWKGNTENVDGCPWEGYQIRSVESLEPAEFVTLATRAEVTRHLRERGAKSEALQNLPPVAPVRTLGVFRVGGNVLGLSLALGRGRVDVLADVNILSNASIGKADNALLGAALCLRDAPGEALFDEYHHGMGAAEYSPSARSKHVLVSALWLFLASLALYSLFEMTRMGKAHVWKEGSRRSVAEYVRAVAWLYQRADQRKAVLLTLAAAVRRAWAIRLGISHQSSPQQFALAARNRRLAVATSLERALAAAAELEQAPEVSQAQFVRLGSHLVRLQAALDRQELSPYA
jgi:hypothetical protein